MGASIRRNREGFITPRRGCASTPWFFSSGPVAVLRHWAGRTRRPEVKRLLSDQRARDRLGHHLLSGSRRMMMMSLHFMKEAPFSTVYNSPPWFATRRGREDVEGRKANVIDPARRHRRLWRGTRLRFCAWARGGRAQPRHQACRRKLVEKPTEIFADQAVERLPLCRDECLRKT